MREKVFRQARRASKKMLYSRTPHAARRTPDSVWLQAKGDFLLLYFNQINGLPKNAGIL
ncbi:MAG: hypothetical protein JZU64_09660 [Rhodoferax sp.]|nr:hypothetical protein [Rhodoferax sp.]